MKKFIGSLSLLAILVGFCTVFPISAQFPAIFGVTTGGTGTGVAFTAGSVVFAGTGGIYTQDITTFQYDAVNHCLTVGSGNSGCASSGAARFFRNTAGVIAVFQNTNAGTIFKVDANSSTGGTILQSRNSTDVSNLPLYLQSAGGTLVVPPLASLTGTRTLCIGTDGTITSSASPCSGT